MTAQTLLDVPIAEDQKKTLLTALGTTDANTPLTPKDLNTARQQQLLHLLTSMAEYQLC